MTSNLLLEPLERDEKLNAIIKLAIMAVGGQGCRPLDFVILLASNKSFEIPPETIRFKLETVPVATGVLF